MSRRSAVTIALYSMVAIVTAAPPLGAHVVMGTNTVRLWTLQSDFVARVRIVDADETLALEEPPLRESVVVAEVLEPLKGRLAVKQLRFVQRGHGVVRYAEGDEVIVFVRAVERNRELANSRIAQHVSWVSEQETGAEFALDDGSRKDFTAAVRAYAASEKLSPEEQPDALRRLTVEMIASPQPALAASAVRDLVLSADAPIVTAEDLPVLEEVLGDPEAQIGVRIGLLAELQRRKLVAGPPRWVALLRATKGAERLAVVRAAGAHPSEAVSKELSKLLSSTDIQLASTAAVSLGGQRNDIVVPPLAELLASSESRLRMAAIRGLGRVGTAKAIAALSEAAASNPDPATRRRAAAEVKILVRGRGPVDSSEREGG